MSGGRLDAAKTFAGAAKCHPAPIRGCNPDEIEAPEQGRNRPGNALRNPVLQPYAGLNVYSRGFAELVREFAMGTAKKHAPDVRTSVCADVKTDTWEQEDEQARIAFKPLTREQAKALRQSQPTVSPWLVVAAQAAVGCAIAGAVVLLAMLTAGNVSMAWSALWGAATAVVPGALMARGMTSRLTSLSPMVSAVAVMVWEMVKIGVSVAMLALAPRVVVPLNWPLLLATLAACLSVYWFALLWRGRKS